TSFSSLISRNNRCCPCFPSSFSTCFSPFILTLTLAIAGAFVIGTACQRYLCPKHVKVNLCQLHVTSPPHQPVINLYHYVRSVTDRELEHLADVVLCGNYIQPRARHLHGGMGCQYRIPCHRFASVRLHNGAFSLDFEVFP